MYGTFSSIRTALMFWCLRSIAPSLRRLSSGANARLNAVLLNGCPCSPNSSMLKYEETVASTSARLQGDPRVSAIQERGVVAHFRWWQPWGVVEFRGVAVSDARAASSTFRYLMSDTETPSPVVLGG